MTTPRTQRMIIWSVTLAVVVVLIHLLKSMLLPFVAGLGIAYLLDPLADRLEARGISRVPATIIITAGFFLVFVGGLILLAPVMQNQIAGIADRLPEFIALVQAQAVEAVDKFKSILPSGAFDTANGGVGNIAGTVGGAIKNILHQLWSGGLAVFQIISLLVITPIVSFYMLLKWDDIVARIDDLLPRPQAETIREQARAIDKTLSAFVRGQASVCLSLAVIYAVSLSVIGLDGGLLIGIGAGAVSFVPYVGAITGITVALGVAFTQFDTWTPIIAVAIVFGVGQTLESYVLTPRLVGDKVGLHDLWIIFALMAGGTLFGFLGVLLAVPAAAVIGVLIRFTASHYRESALYLGDEEHRTPPPDS